MAIEPRFDDVAVLLGGGIESTALVERYLAEGCRVRPVHVSCGLNWDEAELAFVTRFLQARQSDRLGPLIEVRISLAGFLADHWASRGSALPELKPESLEIPHRNMLLLGLAVHCLPKWPTLALAMGTSVENDFSDGNRPYLDRCQELLSLEMERPVVILTPFISMTKTEVIRQSLRDCLSLSFSCVAPVERQHCGRCIKCLKRQMAFQAANIADPTMYASE